MKKIHFHKLNDIEELLVPEDYEEVNLESPATKILTDFKLSKPYTIDSSISAIDTEHLMLKAHVKLKLITDKTNHFLGIVSLNELNQQNLIKKTALGENLQELTVADFMLSKKDLKAIGYTDILNLSINDLIHGLKDREQQHCLVLESEKHRIRGIISTSDIARKLHIPINIQNNISFVDIFNSLNNL
jgi:CBS-domain-containing membrane protein